jgi:Domain of unknown function (DUF4403)
MLTKRSLSLFTLAFCAFNLSGCAGGGIKSLTAPSPGAESFRAEMKKEPSSLTVQFEANADDLTRILNQAIGSEIYKGSTNAGGLSAEIVRNGPIGVTAADNYLYLTMPVSLSLRYSFFKAPPMAMKLRFKLNARITPDWKLVADIYYLGLSDLMADDAGIGPISIKPRSIVEGVTQPMQKLLSDIISSRINEKYPLKPQIARAWAAAQKPVLLDKSYNAWLKITPREVQMSPLSTRNNQARISLGLKTVAELVIGPEPPSPPPIPLPNLKQVYAIDRDFRIALNADLFYSDIRAIAAPLLLNKEFCSDGKCVTIRGFELYGNGDRLIIKIATTGDLNGAFYLAGKPVFDSGTNIFSVQDLDFDMATESLLLTSADWFLHGAIRSVIQDKLKIDMAPRLNQARDLARKAMTQVKLADHIFLEGRLNDIKFHDILVRNDRISIQVNAEGDTAIQFK